MKHSKHSKLEKPTYGSFARKEWAIIGTPCGNIKKLAFALTQRLSADYSIGYYDADHKSHDEAHFDENSAMSYGATFEYTDKISHHCFEFNQTLEKAQFQQLGNSLSAALVNGNHFKAQSQIVVLDAKKEASLQKKLDRLTDVQLILTTETTEIYPFLEDHLAGKIPPVYAIEDIDAIANFLTTQLSNNIPPLYGLVLAGGKSTRMGEDKGAIEYHGIAQREYAAQLLDKVCDKVFISCRSEQEVELESNFGFIADTFTDLGPFGGILSAFRKAPNAAWLVIAADLPLLDLTTLQQLANGRDAEQYGTAFVHESTGFPEPLISIWEPRIYPEALSFLAKGYACPRKVLINTSIAHLPILNGEALKNVNTPTEREDVIKKIKGE